MSDPTSPASTLPLRLESVAASGDADAAATILLGEDGAVQSFDSEAERLFHCRAADAVGLPVWSLLPGFPRALLRQAPDSTSRMLRLEASPRDGSRLQVELALTRLRVGSQRFWVCALSDVARRRSAEESLRRSEESSRRLFENALVGQFQTTPDGHFLRANAALAQIYGYASPDLLVAQQLSAARDLYLSPERRAEMCRLLETQETVWDFESQVRRQDGTTLWISENVRAVREADGTLLHYEGTVQDITAKRQTAEALRRSGEEIRAVFEAAGVGMVRLNHAGTITRANPAFARMLGYAPGELEGTAFARLAHPDDPPANAQHQWDMQEGRCKSYCTEKRLCRRDGSLFLADFSLSVVREDSSQPPFSIAIVEDGQERRQAQTRILALNTDLERRIRRIAALHAIDTAIMSGDREATLTTLLTQTCEQLGAEAAAILLPGTGDTLRCAAARGLHCLPAERVPQPLAFGYAGQAVREQRTVALALSWTPEVFAHDPAVACEGFAAYWAVPLMAHGAVQGVLEVFRRSPEAVDEEWREFLEVLAGQAAIALDSAGMVQELQRTNAELTAAYDATIEGWGRALDLRDQETQGHSERVTAMTLKLAHAVGLTGEALVPLRRGALLHDIGKMGVPDRILLKTDELSPTEWRLMRRHPEDAHAMLSPIAFLRPALDIPWCHHEKWDGTGYPRGLKGEQIPLAARLFAIADVWDALCSDRPYRAAWPEARTLDHIRSLSGTHFDPALVSVFLTMMGDQTALDAPAETGLLPLGEMDDLMPLAA